MSPTDLPVVDYVVNGAVALVGGAVRFLKLWAQNYPDWAPPRVAIEAAIATMTAGFVGALTYWVMAAYGFSGLQIAAACGIMGHAGPDGLAMLKDAFLNAIRSRIESPQK